MHILVANWSWYPTGGDWTYIDNLCRLYEKHGHTVIPFSTHHSKNFNTPFSEYFVKSYDFKELNKNKSPANALRAVKTSVRAGDAVKKLNSLLDKYPVRLAHLHNIHHYLTPAIIEVLHRRGIKIIWTLHDYKIICPENSFVSNGKICEACLGGRFYHCAANRCKKNSRAASLLASIEAYYYHRRKTYTLVDYYLCPSEFLRQQFIRFGFSPEKLVVTNLCYDINLIDKFLTQPKNPTTDRYILYVGRLEVIKGLKTLIRAVKDTPVKLRIAGTGPAETELKTLAGWPENPNVVFEGFCPKEKVFELTQNALCGVCPSEWYENLPYSISETFLFGKPVIGARIGGIPELVVDRETGLLFESGNPKDLRDKLLYIWQHPQEAETMGTNARKHAEAMYTFNNHWKKLEPIIQHLNI
jgi:glycosyltransferase involved in cell wall biosynthesis